MESNSKMQKELETVYRKRSEIKLRKEKRKKKTTKTEAMANLNHDGRVNVKRRTTTLCNLTLV